MIDVSWLNKILKSFAGMKRPNPREIKERKIAFEDYLFCGSGLLQNWPGRAFFGRLSGDHFERIAYPLKAFSKHSHGRAEAIKAATEKVLSLRPLRVLRAE
jgi:hypothetical protein